MVKKRTAIIISALLLIAAVFGATAGLKAYAETPVFGFSVSRDSEKTTVYPGEEITVTAALVNYNALYGTDGTKGIGSISVEVGKNDSQYTIGEIVSKIEGTEQETAWTSDWAETKDKDSYMFAFLPME